MNWKHLRHFPWIDDRAKFVNHTPPDGSLLDIGSSSGETLGHFAELRPDLKLFATDLEGYPEKYPASCKFHRGDIQKDRLPWSDGSMDSIIALHLVEHLVSFSFFFAEAARLLKPGGRLFIETPHLKNRHDTKPSRSLGGNIPHEFLRRCNAYKTRCHRSPSSLRAPGGI